VTSVFYQLNGMGWNAVTTGNAFTNWTADNLELLSGQNEIDAWAADAAGNHSLTNSILFSHKVMPFADWAPDLLSGLTAFITPDVGTPYTVSFDVIGFSETGQTNADFDLGGYFYDKYATNGGIVTLTNTAPPSQTNSYKVVRFTFTDHYAGTSFDGRSGTFQFVIATNLLPSTLARRTLTATSSSGGGITTLKFGSTGTVTTTNNGPNSTGIFTFARYSPVGGLLTVTYTGADLGKSSSVELVFTSATTGIYFVNSLDGLGGPPDVDMGTFVLH
jgi:hypothetical protein